jgi:hypothetical protein
MNEQTWINSRCDRAEWGPGEWDGEPDKVQWTDPETGLVCLAKRHARYGNWCGYVGVDQSHPWHGKSYNDLPDYGPEIHGGLTFSEGCQEGPPEETICHVPEPGAPDNLWWFGFDCHHAWDMAPGMRALVRKLGKPELLDMDETYRPLSYVKEQCAQLAKQLAGVTTV